MHCWWLECALSCACAWAAAQTAANPAPAPQVFDLGSHYLQTSSQKLITGGAATNALTLGTTAGPLTTSEIKAVKAMPSEVVIGRWKETVRELGNILVQVRRG